MKERKSKPTLQERIQTYLDAIPPAIAHSDGHKQTFKVACLLYNGWALTVDETLAWLKVYNAKCQPPWSDKELAHKAKDAAKAKHEKPRGYLLNGSIADQRAEPDWTLPTKPHATGKIPTTLTTVNSNLRARAHNVDNQPRGVHSVIPRARKSENNVVNVVKMTDHSLAGPKIECPYTTDPSSAMASSAMGVLDVSETTDRENDECRPSRDAGGAERPSEDSGTDTDVEARRIVDELVKLHEAGAIKSEQDASFYANLVHLFGASFSAHVGPQVSKQGAPNGLTRQNPGTPTRILGWRWGDPLTGYDHRLRSNAIEDRR